MTTASWYVMHTKPKKEAPVNNYLEAQGFEVFFPSVKVKPVNPRSRKIRPLFPRYLFVRADLDTVGISALRWVPFAIGLVEFDGHPAKVPDRVIQEIKEKVAQLRTSGGAPFDEFQQGDRVRISRGPLAGYEGIFDMRLSGTMRVQLMLDMLGRLVRVQADARDIEKARRRD